VSSFISSGDAKYTRGDSVSKLVFEMSKLPGIGEKTATRLVYFILKQEASYSKALSRAIIEAKEKTIFCSKCFTFTEIDPCKICSKHERDGGVICVVERPSDVFSIERTGVHKGVYHVLHGVLSPLDGVGPGDLKLKELLGRVKDMRPIEVILAMNSSVEGEATAIYISKILIPCGVKVTRLAHGLPVGGFIEYTDHQTIVKAIENRVELTG